MGRTERILAGPCNATLLIPSDATVSKRNICFLASTGLDFRGLTPRDRTNTDRGNDSASRQTRPGISGRTKMREKKRNQLKTLWFLIVAAGLCWPDPISAQFHPKDTEWPSYAADLAGTRYRPLDQINASNFSNLEIAWRTKTDNFGDRPEYKLEGTPLMVNGVLYATAGSRRAVIALDPESGELLWIHGEHEGKRGGAAPRQLSGRGLAYWSDGVDERILYVTPGFRLICLDAKTGQRVPSFGENGVVDLKLHDDQEIFPDLETGEIGMQSAPVVAKDTVMVGAAFREGMTPKSMRNNKGYVRGFDVRTGRRLWIFHTIPRKGEFGYDTWLNGSAEYTGNTGVWTQISVDEQLGLVYLPVESPTSDFYGGHRHGDNLFGETLVCVDLKPASGNGTSSSCTTPCG